MSINLNLRAPAANPLTFQQVDSNFNQLKTAIENVQNSLQSLANVNHNHNDLYYLKSEVNQLLADNRWNMIYDGSSSTGYNVGILGGVKFGWGWGNIPPNNLSNAGIRYSFPKAYDKWGPIVLAQVTSGTNQQHGFIGFLAVTNIDRFGFNINVENSAGALAVLGDNSRNITGNVSFQFFCFAGW